MSPQEAFNRGKRDADKEKAPIFRAVREHIVPVVDDDMADDWSQEDRFHYLQGYDS